MKFRLTWFRLVVGDFLLLMGAIYLTNIVWRGTLVLPEGYGMYPCLFFVSWVVSGLVGKKFSPSRYRGYRGGVVLGRSALYLAYVVALVVVISGLNHYSRVQIFATCGMLLALELVVWGGLVWAGGPVQVSGEGLSEGQDEETTTVEAEPGGRFSFRFFMLDLVLFFAAFFIVHHLKQAQMDIDLLLKPGYEKLLLLMLTLWVGISMVTRKYWGLNTQTLYFALWQWIKAGLLMMAATAVMVFGLRIFQYSRTQGFGTTVVVMGLEVLLLVLYFSTRKQRKVEQDIESVDQVRQVLGQERYDLRVDIQTVRQRMMRPATYKLSCSFQPDDHGLYEFLDEHIDLSEILCVEAQVDRSNAFYPLCDDFLILRLFVGLRKLNDCRRLNVHFLQLHQILLPGGYFVGYAHTIRTHHEWIYSRFPGTLAHGVYALDFLFHRVMPKLPGIQKVYFSITKGRNRSVSRAELLGRLIFCGYEIVATKEIAKRFYFIVRKVMTASPDVSPTYGPLVALKRIGLGGKMVHTYKFRTMHPYSEYLQEYVYQQNGLQKGGKLENDFRMTTWGKVMRKLWLDELPMLYNWVKGDFTLVGVRPLSFQYLSLYDRDLQALRKKVRPGLIPPFYADLPETFEEICESERRYIQSFLAHPVRTQIRYFIKSFINIAFKGARSK